MSYPLYRILLVVFVVAVAGLGVFTIAMRPSRPTSRLGLRGFKRQQSLLHRPLWATVEPFVRWLGVQVSRIPDAQTRAKLDAQLTYAGDFLGLTADEYFGCLLGGGALGALLGAILGYALHVRLGWVPIPVGAGLGAAAPYMIVDAARTERLKAINRGMPYAIDLLALSMSAGLDFPGSLQQVVDKAKANVALREELAYMLQQLQLGRTRTQTLRELAARAPIEPVREFAQAIIQAEERGNPVRAVLEVQAGTARTRRSNQAEKAANDMKAKMVLPTMMLVGVGLMLIAIPSAMMLEQFTGALK